MCHLSTVSNCGTYPRLQLICLREISIQVFISKKKKIQPLQTLQSARYQLKVFFLKQKKKYEPVWTLQYEIYQLKVFSKKKLKSEPVWTLRSEEAFSLSWVAKRGAIPERNNQNSITLQQNRVFFLL